MNGEWHFLRPLWLLALLAVPALIWLYRHRHFAAGRWASVVDPALQPYVLTDRSGGVRGRWLPWALGALFAVLIVALAGPVRERLPQPVYRDDSALVIALDLSQSMNAQDILPTRLTRARLKIRDLLDKRDGGDTALIAFAGDAFTVTPLTDDTATIESLLGSLSTDIMPRQGSLITPALVRAERLLDDAGARRGRIVVIADGVADAQDAVQTSARLATRDIRVSVLGVGTEQGEVVRGSDGELVKDRRGQIVVATMDIPALAAISTAGGGAFTLLTADDTDLDAMLGAGEAALAEGVLDDDMQTDVWREEGPLLVLLCLPFVALMFRRGWIVGIAALAFLPPPPAAHAGLWDDLWRNADQQAHRQFQAGEFAEAAAGFDDRQWRAAAAYRAGDYAASVAALEGIHTPDAHYNRGNALARAGDFDAARAAYDAALALDPDHEDARYNRDLLDSLPPPQNQNAGDQRGESQPSPEQGEQGESEGAPQNAQNDGSQSGGQGQDGHYDDEQSAAQSGQEAGQSAESDAAEDGEAQADEAGDGGDEADGEGQLARALSDEMQERDLAAEQWLRQVPDDPGGLLRRKFERQYRLRYQGQPREPQEW